MSTPRALTLESVAAASLNYLESLVDAGGLPYFNVFWTTPPEAAHDWPDFGDVMSRQLQGAVMLRRMTGRTAATEAVWRRKLLGGIDEHDGQLHRPAAPWCKPQVEDAALPLYALATAALDRDDEALKTVCARMAEGYLRRLRDEYRPEGLFSGFPIKSLMVVARAMKCEAALEGAKLLAEGVMASRVFNADNTFGPKAHMHGNLRSLVGLADYALTAGDPVLYSRVDALYRHVKSTGARFGFIPEVVNWRPSDLIACETCALMDFAGLGVTLANHGHEEYWGDMERLLRNHLLESQLRDTAWLGAGDERPDSEQFTWRSVAQRSAGAWAGWSSPNHILAYRETLNGIWGGPELRDKTRALQNCCGGSGLHALFILWRNAARYADGVLSVHLHLDKRLPEAEIRCQQPYRGLLAVTLAREAAVRIRIPDFAAPESLQLTVNDAPAAVPLKHRRAEGFLTAAAGPAGPVRVAGNYLELGPRRAGDRIELRYPLPVQSEEIAVGNPGRRRWRYRVTWKGDTVVRMEPLENDVATCWSDFDKTEVQVFYGAEGPGPLYQREAMLREETPTPTPLQTDDGGLDFWRIGPPRC
jgi:hypothetical protein